ncbi:hypothetical protein [Rhizobium sp. YS-1r]|uniref:hypothetical protein n=1 Tax=Rhizobium sp. YS-1r TaxID=1532558 RepID=UPI00126A6846|nr:hypothetical protein [Rhizobium sp. YS-1r]
MSTRRLFVLSGALAAIFAAAMPFKLAVDANGVPCLAASSAAAKDSDSDSGDSDSGNGGDNDSAGNGDNGGAGSGGSGNSSGKGNEGNDAGSVGEGAADDGDAGDGANDSSTDAGNSASGTAGKSQNDGSTGSGSGTGTGAGTSTGKSPSTGKSASDKADKPAANSQTAGQRSPTQPATPAARSKSDVKVDVRGNSITVRHGNGATERISQGRYEMRDSRSRTIVNRQATPSDTSRLRSFGR